VARYRRVTRSSHFLNARPSRRQFERRKVEARVAVTSAEGTVYRGWCNDLSEGGLSATIPASLVASTEVDLQLTLPTTPDPIRIRGVVRNGSGFRYGFEFLTLAASQREAISRFVAESPPPDGDPN
jgi:c-di-GMP-binding flagellar brake protein YcgR